MRNNFVTDKFRRTKLTEQNLTGDRGRPHGRTHFWYIKRAISSQRRNENSPNLHEIHRTHRTKLK